MATRSRSRAAALLPFHPSVRDWFTDAFGVPTRAQELGWPAISSGDWTLIFAPTGSGKTLTAFLWALDRLMFAPVPAKMARCRVLYVSPLKALAVDVERNLRSPLAGIANLASSRHEAFVMPSIATRTGDTPSSERARFLRQPADILITTPESLYLMLTSNARQSLRSVETVIIDEIHALVPNKRGAHMALSLERLNRLCEHPPQRIGLSATQRPLEEVARFLGGCVREEVLGARYPVPSARCSVPGANPVLGAPCSVPGANPVLGAPCSVPEALPADSHDSSEEFEDTNVLSDTGHHPADTGHDLSDEKHGPPSTEHASSPDDLCDTGHDPYSAEHGPLSTEHVYEHRPPSTEHVSTQLHDEFADHRRARFRPVTIVDTGEKKKLKLTVEVPVEEMAKLGGDEGIRSGPASAGPKRTSIWPAIHPRLLDLIRAHQSTLIFVNSRRLSERLAAALNELAGQTLVQAHHGSIARAQRVEIEDNLKSGKLPALVATSSLELGIDMGAIDLVIQIEAPPSIASGMQRIGRAAHHVGAVSEGIIFPKYRGDLVACAAVTDAMHRSSIEPTRYPRNPLDVLAQQIVAMVAMEDWTVDDLFATIRGAAPYAALSRATFEGVLDMLSGLYPSDEFAELRPRLTWDRTANALTARAGSKRVAILNGGTIPDRGLYGVFLAGAEKGSARVGELDEEMVFESRVGETFLLGASTWRIEEITHDRVVVSPAPGQPGKMPFWKGDQAERTVPFGEEIGRLVRELREMTPAAAVKLLIEKHDLDRLAAENLLQYLNDQHDATGAVPDDRTIVVERGVDELGDWRICVLTPFGGRIHAPWAMAATAKIRNELAIDVETMWSDDGFIIRFPETELPPRAELAIPDPEELEQLVVRQLGSSSLFAAKFREAAARALLLPRMRAQGRAPLWQQRKRAYDLLQVASRFGSFPMILEAYREVLRDVVDVPALVGILKKLQQRTIRLVVADTQKPSPFAGSLLFRYVANFIYDGDAPLAERRAQALSIDQAQLRALLGEPELRELLDITALDDTERELQHLEARRRARSADALHDLLLRLGDLTLSELTARTVFDDPEEPLLPETTPPKSGKKAKSAAADTASVSHVVRWVGELRKQRRILEVTIAREKRFIATEDASRYRDALGTPMPVGIAERYLRPVEDPTGDLVLRFARTHGPFTPNDVARRYGLGTAVVTTFLERFVERGRLIEGEFRPGGTQREWCDLDVLRTIRRRSLARLRHEVEPVEQPALARLITSWQGASKKRRGLEALLDVIETIQGYPIVASVLESEILPARIEEYRPSDLDTLSAAGEIVWTGVEPLGEHDGRIALWLTDQVPPAPEGIELTPLEQRIADHLRTNGASFFAQLQSAVGGFPNDVVDALWSLVWKGQISNDTFHALRSFTRTSSRGAKQPLRAAFRSRRVAPATTQGRWSLVHGVSRTPTERANATALRLLARYGVVIRESAAIENIAGGFSAVYPILKAMEEAG
ncbi:MAG: DEAD/DEAH box helicase, partial [Acidobacteriota bacterium]